MPLAPQPRFRFYGSSANHRALVAACLTGRIRSDERELVALEKAIAASTAATNALCVPQGRVGLYLALRSLIRPGQSVILSPYTIYDVVNMVICAGGRPVFADVDPESCNIDGREVERLIDAETGAVVVTHLHGLACDIERLAAVCRARRVALVEDAAQCFGGRVGGRHVGTFGDAGVFSFSRAKNVNGLYGGMVVTKDAAVHEHMAKALCRFPYQDLGRLVRRACHCLIGDLLTAPVLFQVLTFRMFRYDCLHDLRIVDRLVQAENDPELRPRLPESYARRMTPLQARLVLRQLGDVERHTQLRIAHARAYHDGLLGLRGIQLPPLREDGSHVYLAFPIQMTERDQLVRHMMRSGRDVKVQHYANAADLPCFAAYARDCPNARTVAAKVLLLPTYPGYGMAEVERNIAAIREYFGAGAAAVSTARVRGAVP